MGLIPDPSPDEQIVPISALLLGTQARGIFTEHVDKLARNIALKGLKYPIEIRVTGHIIDGAHRVEAYKKLGLTEIRAFVY